MQTFYAFSQKLFAVACVAVTLCASMVADAQNNAAALNNAAPGNNEGWYQVEMIVFARNEGASQQEVWPQNIQLVYPHPIVALTTGEPNTLDSFPVIKANDRQLNMQAASIAKSGSYTLLFHQAWRQLITAKNTSVLVNGGKTFADHRELEGSINLSVAQYLKLQTNLWLTQFSAGSQGGPSGWPELPAIPDAVAGAVDAGDFAIKRIVKLDEQRNLRSQEVHYIDHPLFGVIVKIHPVEQPMQ